MGGGWSRLLGFWWQKQVRVLMLGLDGAGKTTVLYHLKLGERISTVPTVGFNCGATTAPVFIPTCLSMWARTPAIPTTFRTERVQYGRLQFTVWDVGGQDVLRALWRHFYKDTDALIYIIDRYQRSLHDAFTTFFCVTIFVCVR